MKDPQKIADRIIEMVESGQYDRTVIAHMIKSQTRRHERKIQRLERQCRPKRFVVEESRIIGGLRRCISEHGPITKDWIGSAAKRIYGNCIQIDNC